MDVVGAVGPNLVFVDLGDNAGGVGGDAALVPELAAEAAEASLVGRGGDDEKVVDGPGLAALLFEGLQSDREERGLKVDITLIVGGPGHVAEVEHDGDGEGVVPSGPEPAGVVVAAEKMELYVAQLVTTGSEGVEEAGGLGADGDGDLIAGGDSGYGIFGGDEVLPVMLLPVHGRGGGAMSGQC